jgi:hypothetical protein
MRQHGSDHRPSGVHNPIYIGAVVTSFGVAFSPVYDARRSSPSVIGAYVRWIEGRGWSAIRGPVPALPKSRPEMGSNLLEKRQIAGRAGFRGAEAQVNLRP